VSADAEVQRKFAELRAIIRSLMKISHVTHLVRSVRPLMKKHEPSGTRLLGIFSLPFLLFYSAL